MGAGLELKAKRKNGRIFPVDITIGPIKTAQGIMVLSIVRDVTDRMKAEEEIAEHSRALAGALYSLKQKNKELQDFLYIASHDLQEPLRKVQGFGDMLKKRYSGELGDEGSDFINRMQNATGRMQKLIDALLHYSRVTTKGKPFQRTDLNNVLSDVLSALELRIEEEQADVRVDRLPVVHGDELQMHQIFLNLMISF